MAPDMEFAIDLMSSLRNRVSAAGGDAADGVIDWFSLQTRFAAAHAARRELGARESERTFTPGGFAQWARDPGGTERGTPDVNPIDLAVRKGAAAKVGVAADRDPCGDRG
jgi:hypothetical protein